MTVKQLGIIFLFLLFSLASIWAQPEPCDPDNPQMTSLCNEACIICSIDGFTGRHESDVVGEAPPGFAGECTFVAHNMQWISFIAGSVDLEVRLFVSNCQQGLGLEFGLYKGENCENLTRISNCFGGAAGIIGPGRSGVIKNIEPLEIGQYYFIVMDGALGDNCDWTFTVLSGSTELAPLNNTAAIQGPREVCPGVIHEYLTTTAVGATIYDWTLNGQSIGSQDSNVISLEFPQVGYYNLCVTAKNVCDEGEPFCTQLEAISIPPTEIIDEFCADDCYLAEGDSICFSGTYNYNIVTEMGCDSMIIYELTQLPQAELFLSVNICAGDSLYIGESPFTSTGVYQENLIDENFCDSIVNLDLFVIICNIESNSFEIPVICHGGASGSVVFEVINGTAPFSYSWQHLQTGSTGTGAIQNVNEMITLDGLSVGTYVIEIQDDFGNMDVIIQELTEPEQLSFELMVSDFGGSNLSCYESNDGTVNAIVIGGVAPYMYNWSDGQTSNTAENLSADTYELFVTDNVGCQLSQSISLVQPDSLSGRVIFVDPNCEGFETGELMIEEVSGGTAPYLYSINGNGFADELIYSGLSPGEYSVLIKDENGCELEILDNLVEADIPIVNLGDDLVINLGDSITIQSTVNNSTIEEITWVSTNVLSCDDCLKPGLIPLNSGNYVIEVISKDGCVDRDSLYIEVLKSRQFYVPNIFSPNGDFVNDIFHIHGGIELLNIDLSIYDRYGNKVFINQNMDPFEQQSGWNGRFNDRLLNPGVFTWVAEVLFIDNEKITYSGHISLIR